MSPHHRSPFARLALAGLHPDEKPVPSAVLPDTDRPPVSGGADDELPTWPPPWDLARGELDMAAGSSAPARAGWIETPPTIPARSSGAMRRFS